jgi:chromosome segregation ATPase
MLILQEEKERSTQEILKLKTTLEELRGQLDEPSPPQPPAGPSAAEQQLEEEAWQLRKALECLEGQLEAQVRENDRLSHHKEDQEERLLVLQQAARIPGKQAEDGEENMKSMENQETLTGLNLVLKEQLAQFQQENMKLTCALLAEQNVKKQLVQKLGQLQENLAHLKVIMEVNSQEAPSWQEEGEHGSAEQNPTGEIEAPKDTEAPKDCLLEVMAEDLEPQGVPVGAIGECIALNALLKEIEDKKAETISTLARDNVELTWELQDLKFQLEDQCKMWQGKF